MARPELGTKRVCPTTGRKFYDLNRDPIVSPYTGEAIPRSAFEPALKPAAGTRARPEEDDEETDVAGAGAEMISLEDVAEGEDAAAVVEDEVALEEDGGAEDTFLEEEEEGGDDVADLIDGDIEDEEEA
ncbi:TIGR02300 family protein [Enterovirga aerilata]|uniref:TIGR02300 family protein n=1 Tax=Enterovirga aerilata TaxID=2730920 RepID=A0A849I179_9HYPH|nr:TIGR02300 family protein [Enterovirga sp. DB1703]